MGCSAIADALDNVRVLVKPRVGPGLVVLRRVGVPVLRVAGRAVNARRPERGTHASMPPRFLASPFERLDTTPFGALTILAGEEGGKSVRGDAGSSFDARLLLGGVDASRDA